MTILEFVHAALPISLMMVVLAIGMRCTWGEAMSLFHEPALLARTLLAMFVLLPAAAVLLATSVDLKPPVKVALVTLALSPVPPILPPKLLKLVTRDSYVYGLMVATSILSIVFIPLALTIIGGVFDRDMHIDPALVAKSVATSVLLPLGLGLLLRHFLPGAATRVAGAVSLVGMLLLAVSLIAILAAGWRGFGALIGDGTLAAFIVFTAIALVVGHYLGGANGDDRTVLALSSTMRHPGVAIVIGASLFPAQKKLIAVAVLLYLIVAFIGTVPYTRWRKKLHDRKLLRGEPTSPGAPSGPPP